MLAFPGARIIPRPHLAVLELLNHGVFEGGGGFDDKHRRDLGLVQVDHGLPHRLNALSHSRARVRTQRIAGVIAHSSWRFLDFLNLEPIKRR